MKRLKRVKIDSLLVLLISISILLCFLNYTSYTFLSGWDTLHPEFDFSTYISRITSFWQEYQGLGTPASQAHIAELPRMLLVGIFMLVFPPSFVRYAYFFLMILLGPAGIYFLVKHVLSKRFSQHKAQSGAFLAGLFYLLNLGTMQHFTVPLEMFATQFGFLGFLYFYAFHFLEKGEKKILIFFALFTIFSSPMAHTATLWYVYAFSFFLFLGTYYFLHKNICTLKRIIILITITITLNLYWILPNLYYALNYSTDVSNSKIHRLFTKEAYYHNKNYGDLSNFLLLKNFLFDWRVPTISSQSIYPFSNSLLSAYSSHLKNPFILFIGYAFSLIAFLGMLLALIKKENTIIPLIPPFLLSSLFLLTNIPIVSHLFEFIREKNTFFAEIFRFPFTKFSLFIIFAYAVFFGYALALFIKYITHLFSKKARTFILSLIINAFAFLLFIFAFPSFSGNFINRIVRIPIEKDYFKMFQWLNTRTEGRILTLPIHTPFGWTYYLWQKENPVIYQGAGFTWFGIKAPTLNREFDRWYTYNEESYREFSYALSAQNKLLFENLLKKYRISTILFDKNIINPGDNENQNKKLFFDGIETMLFSSARVKKSTQFGNISLFNVNSAENMSAYPLLFSPHSVGPSFDALYTDEAYRLYSDYITSNHLVQNNIIYPGRLLLNNKERANKDFFSVGQSSYTITIPKAFIHNTSSTIPKLSDTEPYFYADVFLEKNQDKDMIVLDYLLPSSASEKYTQQKFNRVSSLSFFGINNHIFQLPKKSNSSSLYLGQALLNTKKENTLFWYKNIPPLSQASISLQTLYPYQCSTPDASQVFGAQAFSPNSFKLYGENTHSCVDIPFKTMVKNPSVDGMYTISFTSFFENKNFNEGFPDAEFCIFDDSQKQCIVKKKINAHFFTEKNIEEYFSFENEKRDDLIIRFSLKTKEEKILSSITISDISLSFTPLDTSQSFYTAGILENTRASSDTLVIKGKFPYAQITSTISSIPTEKKECGFEKTSFINKQKIMVNGEETIEYTARDGSICESFNFPELTHETGYLMAITSQNKEGLPFKICFENDQNKTCVLEDETTAFDDADTDYFIIPPYGKGVGYNLILNTFSIGKTTSINRLKNIRVIPFPYLFIQALHWKKNPTQFIQASQSFVQLTKHTPYLYTAQLEVNDPSYYLPLYQAYEKNWKAYQIKNVPRSGIPLYGKKLVPSEAEGSKVKSFFTTLFPFIFGTELKEHVLVNNWANGWRLNGTNSTIVIIFLPQYLEFIGFFVLVVTLIFILRMKKTD